MNDLIELVAEEANDQIAALPSPPVAIVFIAFSEDGTAAAGTGCLPEALPMLAARLVDAAIDVRNDLAAQLAALHQSAEQLTALAIQKARAH